MYIFHSDGGHGWAEVARTELVELGIEDKITSFSYERDDKVYLEEDCDLATFIDALEDKFKRTFKFEDLFIHRNDGDDSPIRNYSCFNHHI
jgi:hypothetical protein